MMICVKLANKRDFFQIKIYYLCIKMKCDKIYKEIVWESIVSVYES